MELNLTTPIQSKAVAKLTLNSSTYTFDGDDITLSYNELASDGSLIQVKLLTLTSDQVSAFLDVLHPGDTLRVSFISAFMAALEALYGDATVA